MLKIIRELIDEKLLRILKVFLNDPLELHHIQDISNQSKVPLATTFRAINKLTELSILEVKTISKLKLYKMNKKYVKELEQLQ